MEPVPALFVIVRVISWILLFAAEQSIHEVTRKNTNEGQARLGKGPQL